MAERLDELQEATRQRSITEQLAYPDAATPAAGRLGLCECVRWARHLLGRP